MNDFLRKSKNKELNVSLELPVGSDEDCATIGDFIEDSNLSNPDFWINEQQFYMKMLLKVTKDAVKSTTAKKPLGYHSTMVVRLLKDADWEPLVEYVFSNNLHYNGIIDWKLVSSYLAPECTNVKEVCYAVFNLVPEFLAAELFMVN